MPYPIPILFAVFNRPDTTQRVFEKIRQQQPLYLYIAADGPRQHRSTDTENCVKTRAIIQQIDWPCTVQRLYHETNLGCGKAISQAISWFFDHVEYGIILEDDCLPEDRFFPYCEALLLRYKDDPRIGVINGNSFLPETYDVGTSYYFSAFPHIWGWASWRRVWKHYDYTMADWPEYKKKKWLQVIFRSLKDQYYWGKILDAVYAQKIDTWDYQLTFSCLKHSMLCIVPKHNLVTNIGFGTPDATHTHNKRHRLANLHVFPLTFPLEHPTSVHRYTNYDAYTQRLLFCWWKMALKQFLPDAFIRWYKKRQ